MQQLDRGQLQLYRGRAEVAPVPWEGGQETFAMEGQDTLVPGAA